MLDFGENHWIISPHASMQRWNCSSIQSINNFRSWNVVVCSTFLDVLYTVDLNTIALLDAWTSGVICKVDFKWLWGLFGKLIFHHFDWEPGVCHFPAFSWNCLPYFVGLVHFFEVSVEGSLGLSIIFVTQQCLLQHGCRDNRVKCMLSQNSFSRKYSKYLSRN